MAEFRCFRQRHWLNWLRQQLLRDVRDFADRHELGYTIHMTQSQAEVDFMLRYHGMRPALFLQEHGYLGPRLFAAHAVMWMTVKFRRWLIPVRW